MELKDFLPLPDLEACKSVLCVQPHPDDNEVGIGGTIAKLAARGCKVTYLTVTDGGNGSFDPAQPCEETAAIRRKEVERSAALLGVSALEFLNFKDGGYEDEKALAHAIVSVIRRVKPEIVLTVDPFLPYECHPDHRRVGMATAEASMFSPFCHFMPDAGGPAETGLWAVKGIGFHTTAAPNTFVNVDDTWELKIKALAAHESQFDTAALQRVGYYFDFKARAYAQGRGFERAEAIKLLAPDHLHMCVDTVSL